MTIQVSFRPLSLPPPSYVLISFILLYFFLFLPQVEGLAELDKVPSSTSLAEMEEAPPRTLVPATCLHDFTGEGEGDISVKRNDIIKVDGEQLSKREEWVYAELSNGVSGYIPISYVKHGVHGRQFTFFFFLSSSSFLFMRRLTTTTTTTDLEEELRNERKWVYAEVLYSYEALKGDELSMKVGDILMIVEKQEDPDWRTAQMNGREGYIPTEYVKIVTKVSSLSCSSQKTKHPSTMRPFSSSSSFFFFFFNDNH